jgi:hypothetical protein
MDAGVIFMKNKEKLSPQVIIAGENQASLALKIINIINTGNQLARIKGE